MYFFTNCKSEEEKKTLFRKLSHLFHPDKSGDRELMAELLKQYKETEGHYSNPFNEGFAFNFTQNPHVMTLTEELNKLRSQIIILKDENSRLKNSKTVSSPWDEREIEILKRLHRTEIDQINFIHKIKLQKMLDELNSLKEIIQENLKPKRTLIDVIKSFLCKNKVSN